MSETNAVHESMCSNLCRCPPHNIPQPPPEQTQQDTGADKQKPRTATWFFLRVQDKATKSSDTFPACAITSTYQQLVYSNYSSLWSFSTSYFFVSLVCITFGVFWFGMLATFSHGKTYVCTGKWEVERGWQEQVHLCMGSSIVLCCGVHISRNTACVLLLISGLFLKPMWGRQNWLHSVSKNIKISREVELFLLCISSAALFRKATHIASKKCFSPAPSCQEILFIAEPEERMQESLVQSSLSALSLTGNICTQPGMLHLHESRGKGGREHMNFTEWVSWYKQEWFKHKHIPDIQVSDFAPFIQSAPLLFWSPPFQMQLSPLSWTKKAQKSLNCVGMLCSAQ